MLLHLGNDEMVLSENIEFILDYEEAIKNEDTKLFLNHSKKDSAIINIVKKDIKSIIFIKEKEKNILYFSPISSTTLLKRSYDNFNDYSLVEKNTDLSELKWNS